MITGGSVGIGLAVAKGLAAEGAHVAIAARNAERLEAARAEIAGASAVRVVAVACDVATPEGAAELVRAAEKEFGGADILVNNAGTGSNETIMDADDAKWQSYWDLHVMAAVRLARGLVPSMRRRGGGVILNNASICAAQPLWYEPIYNVTKAALVMLSKNMASEFIKDGIRVNAINAGLRPDPGLDQDRQAADGGQGRRLAGLHRQSRQGKRADRPLRLAGGDRGLRRVPLFGASQLFRGFGVFHRRRDAEDDMSANGGEAPSPLAGEGGPKGRMRGIERSEMAPWCAGGRAKLKQLT